MKIPHISEAHAEKLGKALVKLLKLKPAPNGRYDLEGGDKTALGVALTVIRCFNETKAPKPRVTLNKSQGLYVIPLGDREGFSCLGFDVCIKWGTALAAELGETFDVKKGTLRAYRRYQALQKLAYSKNRATGWRSASQLTPQLIGLEGKRVEVLDCYGETRRFQVGKSTGWIPCHIEISNSRSRGGVGVTGAPFKSVKIIS